jgi:hypothetical protein
MPRHRSLLFANLTLYLYTRLDGGGGGEAIRLSEQVQPDKIKLLTPQQVAALGPAKVAALADVCVEWGPFSEAESRRSRTSSARARAPAVAEARRVRQRLLGQHEPVRHPRGSGHADRGPAPCGVKLAVADAGRGQFAVSLGYFRGGRRCRVRRGAGTTRHRL